MFKKLLAFLLAICAAAAFAAGVDVNAASPAELDGLKGIGPTIAARIVDERKKNGPYKDWQDLIERVKGVGEGNAAKFSAEGMTVNGSSFKGAPAATAKKDDAKPAAPAAPAAKPAATASPTATAPATAPAPPAASTAAAAPAAAASKPMTAAEKKAAAKKEADEKKAAARKEAEEKKAAAKKAADEKKAAAKKEAEEKKAAARKAAEDKRQAASAAAAKASAPAAKP